MERGNRPTVTEAPTSGISDAELEELANEPPPADQPGYDPPPDPLASYPPDEPATAADAPMTEQEMHDSDPLRSYNYDGSPHDPESDD